MLRLVTFFGDKVGDHGMPDPFHQYAVFITENPAPGVSVSATVSAITEGTPPPTPAVFARKQGGPDDAYREAVDALNRLHRGLQHTEA